MTKRFGLEGLESMITGLHTFFEEASSRGVKDITLGMAHRGRLNVLANSFGKSMTKIFKEMMGKQRDSEGEIFLRSGDVKYHLGHSQTKKMNNGKQLSMEILLVWTAQLAQIA
jgi:2-oxoglutarate dehydrogenase E1 component